MHRIVQAAKLTGTTTHSLMLEAIAEKADQVERRADFDAVAEQRYADIVESGETVSWDEMRTYLECRIVGEKPPRPQGQKAGEIGVARIELSPGVSEDFEQILDHLLSHQAVHAAARLHEITQAIGVLHANPLLGRPTGNDMRELVIGQDAHGYLALYCFVAEIDTVFVLAIRGQREVGFARP